MQSHLGVFCNVMQCKKHTSDRGGGGDVWHNCGTILKSHREFVCKHSCGTILKSHRESVCNHTSEFSAMLCNVQSTPHDCQNSKVTPRNVCNNTSEVSTITPSEVSAITSRNFALEAKSNPNIHEGGSWKTLGGACNGGEQVHGKGCGLKFGTGYTDWFLNGLDCLFNSHGNLYPLCFRFCIL